MYNMHITDTEAQQYIPCVKVQKLETNNSSRTFEIYISPVITEIHSIWFSSLPFMSGLRYFVDLTIGKDSGLF